MMTPAEAIALLPKRSTLRPLIPKLVSKSAKVRGAAFDQLETLDRHRGDEDPYEASWRLDEKEAVAYARIAGELAFPPQPDDWNDTAHEIAFALVRSPHAAAIPALVAAYPRVSEHARCAVLAALGAIGTRASATAFVQCVLEHGWPPSPYSRVFDELRNLAKFAPVLYPALLLSKGAPFGELVDTFANAVARKLLDPKAIDHTQLAPLIEQRLAAKRTDPTLRGALLDLAGYVPGTRPTLDRLLVRDLALAPAVAVFAATSLVRRGRPVPAKQLARIAGDHATRTILFNLLAAQGKRALAKFPAKERTWDAFAASGMVEWLSHGGELGHPPSALEQMAVQTTKRGAMYVFRFRDGKKPKWMAGMCAFVVRRGTPKPFSASHTFSKFERWEDHTVIGHIESMFKTLLEWGM